MAQEKSRWAVSEPTLAPLGEAIARAITPGATLELAAANLGVVKRDWEVKAESLTANGNQRYVGTVATDGGWQIERSTPALSRAQLVTALDCGRKFVARGPWEVNDKAEAGSVLMLWLSSPQANINPMAVRRLLRFRGLRFEKAGTAEEHRRMGDIDRRLYGLALGFFRHRLARGPVPLVRAGRDVALGCVAGGSRASGAKGRGLIASHWQRKPLSSRCHCVRGAG